MRRLYRRRADMIVFATVAAVSVGVVAIYFELQKGPATDLDHDADAPRWTDEPRLVLLPSEEPPRLRFDPGELEEAAPMLAQALEEAARTGSATIEDPLIIDAVWHWLDTTYGIADRSPLVVGYGDVAFRLQMVR